MSEITFSPDSYRKAGNIVDEGTQMIKAEIDKLLDSVSDVDVLGRSDTIGKIASFIYQVFLETFREIVHSLIDGLIDQSEALKMVAETYQQAADAAQALSSLVGKDY